MTRTKINEEIKKAKLKEYNQKYYKEKTIAKRAKIKAKKELILKNLTLEEQILQGLVKPKTCPVCGSIFTSERRKYCCEACRKIAIKLKNSQLYKTPKYQARQEKYRQSESYKANRKKYSKTAKFKEAQKRYRESDKYKSYLEKRKLSGKLKEAQKRYYDKKRQVIGRAICPICEKEFIKSIEHRKYCCEACKKLATNIRLQLKNFRNKKDN